MSADFTPTHRTNRSIGHIKSGSPIRVAKYDDTGFFSDLIGQLRTDDTFIEYHYDGEDVMFWGSSPDTVHGRIVMPGDYVISDGEHFEVSDTDYGWDVLPEWKVSGTEAVDISFHETYFCLHGEETGKVLRLTPGQLRDLSAKIEDALPVPEPLTDARLVHAEEKKSLFITTFAQIEGMWYDMDGGEWSEEHLLGDYNITEVLR